MGWFVGMDRTNHPCHFPSEALLREHRLLEFWRCEVCDDLFQLQGSSYTGRGLKRITSPWLRWRYRKEGYTGDKVP